MTIFGQSGDFVLIIDENDPCYLQVGKIVDTIKESNDSYINAYVINFNSFSPEIPRSKLYDGYIFMDYKAKILSFKE